MNTLNFWLDNWTTILGWLGSAGIVSVVLQVLKKKFHIDGAKMVHILLVVFSALPVVVDYIINYGQQNPDVLPKNFTFVFTLAVTVHRFLISPISGKIENFLQTTYADAKKYQSEQTQTAPQPVVASSPAKAMPIQDFTIDTTQGDR